MPVANTREQAIRLHLEKIQNTIANRLCIGALAPERRDQCAEDVAQLKQQARDISSDPDSFHINQPWETNDPDQRVLLVELNVNSVFRLAPEGHLLTECLIIYWKDQLEQVATTGDPDKWGEACSQMRRDADVIRRSQPKPIDTKTFFKTNDPANLILSIQTRLATIAKQRLQSKKGRKTPFDNAYTEAMQQINQRTTWLLNESVRGSNWAVDDPSNSITEQAINQQLRAEFLELDSQITQLNDTVED